MRSSSSRLGLLAVLLVGISVWMVIAGGPSGGELKRTVDEAGWLAPVAFVAIYVGWTVLLLPGAVATLAGGALFGVLVGSLLTMIGAVSGAALAFAIARRVGRTPVKELAGTRGGRLEQWLRVHGFVALLYARLVPIVPFNILNYAAGLAGVPMRSYMIATAIGIVPGTVAYTALGSAAAHPGSVPFIVSLAAVVLLTVIVGALSRRRREPGTVTSVARTRRY